MKHESRVKFGQAEPDSTTIVAPLSRRTLLKTGATALGVVLSASMQRTAKSDATDNSDIARANKFMKASQLLIQHHLSAAVGKRMITILHSSIPTLDADLDAIIRIASEKKATKVEDFFGALPDGHIKDSAHQIIFGWYAGVVDDNPDAEVFAYEQALMYQPTKDAIALPTYAFNGPNNWSDIDPPLSDMPDF